jgi:uncharacterized protein YyaL (SSP411 family)
MNATSVKWLEWNDEAFAKAKAEDKPILLDIGAVWCHWCHRMDSDTYSHPQVSALVNEYFTPVKVDNDRRPDINARYNMGGWPTTAFLTPDGEIITGATYVPPTQMINLMRQVLQAYHNNKETLLEQAAQAARQRKEAGRPRARPDARLSWGIVTQIVGSIARHYDPVYGGLGTEPKFPQAEAYDLLLAEYANGGKRDDRLIDMVVKSLVAMGSGGMYDQIEGGWFRYSTTRDWSVPHFEKMTEDAAKLLATYLHAYQVTGDEQIKAIAQNSLDYMTRTLYDPARGAFAGSQDADEDYYALSSAERAKMKAPFVDWTVYTDWNSMMAHALLLASSALGEASWHDKALRLLDHLWATCHDESSGALYHFVDGDGSHLPGLLTDHARLAQASLTAFQFTGDVKHLERAKTLARVMLDRLADSDGGGFFDRLDDPTAPGALRTRMKQIFENAAVAEVFITLHHLTGEAEYLNTGEQTLLVFADEYSRYDYMAAAYGLAVNCAVNEPTEIAAVGATNDPRTQALLTAAWQVYVPWRIVLPLDPARDASTVAARGFPPSNVPAAFVCRGQTCSAPVSEPALLVNLLSGHQDSLKRSS